MSQSTVTREEAGRLLYAALTPHPPIMVPAVGRGQEVRVAETIQAMRRVSREIEEIKPETVIVISPHGPMFQDAVALAGTPQLSGDFAQFGASQIRISLSNDLRLVEAIQEAAGNCEIPTVLMTEARARRYSQSTALDHGALVPLFYLTEPYLNREQPIPFQLVSITYALLSLPEQYRFGMAIQEAIRATSRQAAIIASGDLSHRLTLDAPAGYRPEGEEFDRELVRITASAQIQDLFRLPSVLIERAGECGLRSFVIAWGAAEGLQVRPEVYSYQGPFGVGYMVANLGVGGSDPNRRILTALLDEQRRRVNAGREQESAVVHMARAGIEAFVRREQVVDSPAELPPELPERAGVFVSIKKGGQLRGCIGTTEPTQETLAAEILSNAIQAATRDPRFSPIQVRELPDLEYSVDILGVPESVEDVGQLDPDRYGVIVNSGGRRGLLLPELEGVETAEQQLTIARRKAGIGPGEPVRLERFTVRRFK